MTVLLESFNKADALTLGPDLTWTELLGDFRVVDQKASAQNDAYARAESDLATDKHYAEVDVVAHNTNQNAGLMVRMSSGADTGLAIFVRNSASNTYRLFQRVAGVLTQIGSTVNATPPTVPYRLRLEIGVDGVLRGLVDDVQVISTTPPTPLTGNVRTGIIAFAGTANLTQLDNFEAGDIVTDGIAMGAPVAYRTYQRDGNDQADITVSGTYSSETVTAIEYQIDGGSWLTLDGSPSGGSFSGTISDVAAGGHTISVRLNDDTGITDTVANVLVGDVILVIGQSNAAGRLTNQQSYTHASLKAAKYDSTWSELADPFVASGSDGSPWPLLATQWLADQGVPLAVLNYASGGTTISQWWDGTAQSLWTTAKAAVTTSGVNALAAVVIDIGETDAINDTTTAAFNEDLDGLANDVFSTYGVPLIVAHTGMTTSIDANSDLDAIREAQVEAWGDNANVKPGPLGYDRNAVHWQSDAEGLTIAGRWWLAIEAVLYGGANARGPRFVSAIEREDRDQITVTVDRTLTTNAAEGVDGWIVTDDGTPNVVTTVSASGTEIVLTLTSPLTGSNTLVTFASGNDAAGDDIPTSAAITLPDASTLGMPLEPFIAEQVSAYPDTTKSMPFARPWG